MPPRPLLPALLALASSLVFPGCSGGGVEAAPSSTAGAQALRVDGSTTHTAGVMAATAGLMASGGQTALHGGRGRFIATSPLGFELNVHAAATLRTLALESGAGAHLIWSTRTTRLAAAAGAPADGNGNGTNRDEVLAAEWRRFEQLTGGTLPANAWPSFALYREADPRYGAAPDWPRREQDVATLRWDRSKLAVGFGVEGLGHEAAARVLRAASLLQFARGDAPGRTPAEGMEGLLLLQQALALEEFVLGELAFDGTVLGTFEHPEEYDPAAGLRWFPTLVRAAELPQPNGLPPRPDQFAAVDPSSDLLTQAALLSGFAELAWLGSPNQPDRTLALLFEGKPFGGPPDRDRFFGSGPTGGGPQGAQITYRTHIAAFMVRHFCNACHPSGGGSGGFVTETYEDLLRGGDHRVNNPTIVPFQAERSLLWQVLALNNPPVAIRMPQGGPYLAQSEIDLIRDWINQGALKAPDFVPAPPSVPGRAVARVVVRNLRAMHFDPQAQVLVDTHDGRSRSSHVDAAAAGQALAALALALEALPDEPGVAELLAAEADFVAGTLVAPDGAVRAGFTLGSGPDDRAPGLQAQAAVVYGLLEAFRRTGQATHLAAARSAGQFLLTRFWDAGASLFRTQLDQRTRVFDARTVAVVCAALRDLAGIGVAQAAEVHDRFGFKLFRGPMMLAEWQETGEVVGDGVSDTNRNGVPEVPLAGGPFGTAPVFASRLIEGPSPDTQVFPGQVSWSRHVKPLLRGACGQCHLGGNLRGEFDLETWEGAHTQGESRRTLGTFPTIVPGAPERSLLYLKVEQRVPPVGNQMPEALPPLTAPARALIAEWIRQGALNN